MHHIGRQCPQRSDRPIKPLEIKRCAILGDADVDVIGKGYISGESRLDDRVRKKAVGSLPHKSQGRIAQRFKHKWSKEVDIGIDDNDLVPVASKQHWIGQLAPAGMAITKPDDSGKTAHCITGARPQFVRPVHLDPSDVRERLL